MRCSMPGQIGEKPQGLAPDYSITFAGRLLEPCSVRDADSAARIVNQTFFLQFFGGKCYAFASYSQYAGDHFLRRGHVIFG